MVTQINPTLHVSPSLGMEGSWLSCQTLSASLGFVDTTYHVASQPMLVEANWIWNLSALMHHVDHPSPVSITLHPAARSTRRSRTINKRLVWAKSSRLCLNSILLYGKMSLAVKGCVVCRLRRSITN